MIVPEDIKLACHLKSEFKKIDSNIGVGETRRYFKKLATAKAAPTDNRSAFLAAQKLIKIRKDLYIPWLKSSPLSEGDAHAVAGQFFSSEVWNHLNCNCDPTSVSKEMNKIAKATQQGPLGKQQMVAEDIASMFGPAGGNLNTGTYTAKRKVDDGDEEEIFEIDILDEDEEELEEMSTSGGGAVEGYAGKRDDEQEGLIREIEDYLLTAAGVNK
jgi:hypothetical protein